LESWYEKRDRKRAERKAEKAAKKAEKEAEKAAEKAEEEAKEAERAAEKARKKAEREAEKNAKNSVSPTKSPVTSRPTKNPTKSPTEVPNENQPDGNVVTEAPSVSPLDLSDNFDVGLRVTVLVTNDQSQGQIDYSMQRIEVDVVQTLEKVLEEKLDVNILGRRRIMLHSQEDADFLSQNPDNPSAPNHEFKPKLLEGSDGEAATTLVYDHERSTVKVKSASVSTNNDNDGAILLWVAMNANFKVVSFVSPQDESNIFSGLSLSTLQGVSTAVHASIAESIEDGQLAKELQKRNSDIIGVSQVEDDSVNVVTITTPGGTSSRSRAGTVAISLVCILLISVIVFLAFLLVKQKKWIKDLDETSEMPLEDEHAGGNNDFWRSFENRNISEKAHQNLGALSFSLSSVSGASTGSRLDQIDEELTTL
jgi:hypothetical protein